MFEIAVRRDKDKTAGARVLQNSEIAGACQAVSERAPGLRQKIPQYLHQFRRTAFVEEKLWRDDDYGSRRRCISLLPDRATISVTYPSGFFTNAQRVVFSVAKNSDADAG